MAVPRRTPAVRWPCVVALRRAPAATAAAGPGLQGHEEAPRGGAKEGPCGGGGPRVRGPCGDDRSRGGEDPKGDELAAREGGRTEGGGKKCGG
jgi:hypothetical protein